MAWVTTMGIINVDNVKPGMVLAAKVLTAKNMLLLPEGVTITAGHMMTFRTWGITEVNVVGAGDDNEPSTALSEEELDAIKKDVQHIFKHNDLKGKFTAKLFDIACSTAGSQ